MWDEDHDILETFDEHELEYSVEDSYSDLEIDIENAEVDEFDEY